MEKSENICVDEIAYLQRKLEEAQGHSQQAPDHPVPKFLSKCSAVLMGSDYPHINITMKILTGGEQKMLNDGEKEVEEV